MKKLVLLIAVIFSISFISCDKTCTCKSNDTTNVDTVLVDTTVVDSLQ